MKFTSLKLPRCGTPNYYIYQSLPYTVFEKATTAGVTSHLKNSKSCKCIKLLDIPKNNNCKELHELVHNDKPGMQYYMKIP